MKNRTISEGVIEVSAWARASRNTAEREGFDRVAARIEPHIETLDSWAADSTAYVTIIPNEDLHAIKEYRNKVLAVDAFIKNMTAEDAKAVLQETYAQLVELNPEERHTITILDLLENGVDHVLDR